MALSGCAASPSPKQQLTSAFRDLDQRRYDEAFAAADAYLRKTPAGAGSAEALYLQGRVHEARAEQANRAGGLEEARGQLVAAVNAYQAALRLSPPPKVEGLARAGVASATFHLQDYGTAVREWAQAYPLLQGDDVRAWTLLYIGLSQQRLGWFDLADRTFDQLRRELPVAANGEPAARAGRRIGHRAFYVQVGVYANPTSADREIANLRADRVAATRGTDPATGGQIVRAGPLATFGEARSLQARLAGKYRDAVVVP